jgi:c-di-GMP-binding flagellar brake protein YcgR
MAGEERRRFPRLPMDTEIEYCILNQVEAEYYTTGSKNISSGGLCIIVIERLECGAVLNLKFSLPDLKKIINARGRVAWVKELRIGTKKAGDFYEAGIEFMQINKSDRNKIKDYVVSKLGRMKAMPGK